jgi:hypothetical protein
MAKNTTKAVAVPYEPTPEEQAVLDAARERRGARARAPRFKIEGKGKAQKLVIDHPHLETGGRLLMEALGTASPEFVTPFLNQITNAASKGQEPDEAAINFMLAVINGIEPRDEIEAMLAAQMAAVHIATMRLARSLAQVETIPQQDSAARAFNKLMRTFTTQMEALKRYRTGGQQKVVVEHVHVHSGGQAIVGAVEAGGGVANKSERQPHAKAISHAPVTPLRSEDEERELVPVAGDAER